MEAICVPRRWQLCLRLPDCPGRPEGWCEPWLSVTSPDRRGATRGPQGSFPDAAMICDLDFNVTSLEMSMREIALT